MTTVMMKIALSTTYGSGFQFLCALILSAMTVGKCSKSKDAGTRRLLADIEPFLRARRVVVPRNITVIFRMSLTQILSLDGYEQIVEYRSLISMSWKDPFFTWSKEEYDGVEYVRVPAKKAWQPDVVIYNCMQKEYEIQFENPFLDVSHNGTVFISYPMVSSALCHVNVYYFPFDKQICPLIVGSWSYGTDVINLTLHENANDLSEYKRNSEWTLEGFTAKRQEEIFETSPFPYSLLYYNITVQREWASQGLYLILPNFFMDIVNIVQFLLPCDSDERVGTGKTLFFSSLVFVILVETVLPKSDEFPLLVLYMFSTLLTIALGELITIFVVTVHNHGVRNNPPKVPKWVKKFVLQWIAKLVCLCGTKVVDETGEHVCDVLDIDDYIKHIGSRKRTQSTDELTEEGICTEEIKREDGPDHMDDIGILTHEQSEQSKESQIHKIQENVLAGFGGGGQKRKQTINTDVSAEQYLHTQKKEDIKDTKKEHSSNHERPFLKTADQFGGVDSHVYHIKLTELANYRTFLLQSIYKLGQKMETRMLEELKGKLCCVQWKKVAMVIDRLMFYLLFLAKVSTWTIIGTMLGLHIMEQ